MKEVRPPRLQGKVITVTGAGTGLGHAAALRAAHEGARLALLDIDAAALERSRTTILAEVSRAEISTVTGDVSQKDQVRDYVEQTLGEFGRIDALYNNAGIEGEQNPPFSSPTRHRSSTARWSRSTAGNRRRTEPESLSRADEHDS